VPFPKKASENADKALKEMALHKMRLELSVARTAKIRYEKYRAGWLFELLNYRQQLRVYESGGWLYKLANKGMYDTLRQVYIVDIQKNLVELREVYYDPEIKLLRNLKGYE
jgi:hypothetical protein